MILALIKLTRPYYSLPLSCGLVVISAYITGGDFGVLGTTLWLACASLYLVLSAAYTLNDVCDIRVDAINSPERALPKGIITPKTAAIQSIALFAIGIILAVFCGRRFFAGLVLVAVGLIIYDRYSKKMGVLKNIMAAALTVSLYPLSFALTDSVPTPRLNALTIFPAWLFLTAVGYEMLKDTLDVQGDSIRKRNQSFCESPNFLMTARVIIMAAALLSMLPYVLGYCKLIYLASSIVTIALAVWSLKLSAAKAIPLVYAGVVLITVGSLADLLVFGP